MQATETLAIPVLRQSFRIISCHQEETQSWTERLRKC